MSELPKGWIVVTLGEVCSKPQYGYTTKSCPEGRVQYLRTTDLSSGKVNWGTVPYCLTEPDKVDKYQLEHNDIVISRAGSVGYHHLIKSPPNNAVFASYLIRFKPLDCVEPRYLSHFLNSRQYWSQITEHSAGVAVQNVNAKKLASLVLPVAPLDEQKRIADKLDSVLAKVEAAQARLDKIPTILKRFRQSVLAAATSGELTKEWREENGLDRGDPKGAYPESWQQLMIDDIAEVKGGKRLPKGEALVEQDTGYLYIRAGQLKNGTVIDGNDTRNRQMFISNEVHQQIKRYTVEGGDAYITIVGASIGDAGVIPDRVSGANLTENAAKLTNFKVPLSVDFLSCWLRSETLQALIKLEIKSGAQGKLALKRIKTLPFPYPSLNEQRAIVKKFEELTIMSENVEKQYQAAKNRLDKLTQSILAKAFKGELLSNSVDSNIEAIENSIEALNA